MHILFLFLLGYPSCHVKSCRAERERERENPPCPLRLNHSRIAFGSFGEDLDAEASVRASPLGIVTSGCGRHWSLKADIEVEDVTVSSQYYDAFLSHEWGSSGFLKVLTIATCQKGWAVEAVEPEGLLIINAFCIATVLQFQTYRKALLDARKQPDSSQASHTIEARDCNVLRR